MSKTPTKTRKHHSKFQGRQEADYTALWWGVGFTKKINDPTAPHPGQVNPRTGGLETQEGEDAETPSPWGSDSTGSSGLDPAWSRAVPVVEDCPQPVTASHRRRGASLRRQAVEGPGLAQTGSVDSIPRTGWGQEATPSHQRPRFLRLPWQQEATAAPVPAQREME